MTSKITFGGGCHWCTEAVFQSLKGVDKVEQGFVASLNKNTSFSEGVIVFFDATQIDLGALVEIHLRTHKSTSDHSMRSKYRSAVYTFSDSQRLEVIEIIRRLQNNFENNIITEVLPFSSFKWSSDQFQNYYLKNPEKPFCKTYIDPKLNLIRKKYSKFYKENRYEHEEF